MLYTVYGTREYNRDRKKKFHLPCPSDRLEEVSQICDYPLPCKVNNVKRNERASLHLEVKFI